MTIRVALVGAGYWGSNLLRIFRAADGFGVTTVCDVNAELLAEVKTRLPNVSVNVALDEILHDPTIDAVVVATPPVSHFTIAHAALCAGKHVWVEKPLALRFEEGQRLVTVARERRLALFVDETFLYDPLLQQIRARLYDGVIGKIHHVSLERTGMGRIRRDSNVWWNSAPHDVSILRYVLNSRVRQISVVGHAFLQPGVEDVAWASLQMECGASVHLYLHWLFPEKKAPMMIVGELGMIGYEGRFEQRSWRRYMYRLGVSGPAAAKEANLVPLEHSEVVEAIMGDPHEEPLAYACTAFRESILSGTPARSGGSEALHTLAVLEAGAQSLAHNGAWMTVPDEKAEG